MAIRTVQRRRLVAAWQRRIRLGRAAVLAVRLLRPLRLYAVGTGRRRAVLVLWLRRHLCRPVRALRLSRSYGLPAAAWFARHRTGPARAIMRRGQPRNRRAPDRP